MRIAEGVVIMVQESRFQLIGDDGVARLFVLSHGAAVEPADLVPLQARQARIRVRYGTAPNLIAHTAHRIELCDPLLGQGTL